MIDDVKIVLETLGLDAHRFRPGSLEVETNLITTPAEVQSAVEQFRSQADCAGWIQTTSRLGGHDVELDAPVLCCELTCTDHTLRVRQAPAGWLATTLTAKDGDDAVVERVEHLGRRPFGTLKYDVYWTLEEDANGTPALAPWTSRLIGGGK